MIYEIEDGGIASSIFADWDETIIWSCLQGVMGRIYANDKSHPDSAMAILGDFCFFAGRPDRELAAYKPEWQKKDFIIAVPRDLQWAKEIEHHYGTKAKMVTRYAMKKEPDIFNKDKLSEIVRQLPLRYIITLIDERIYPSWDAQNLWSVGLAEKLGYHFSHRYKAYEILGY